MSGKHVNSRKQQLMRALDSILPRLQKGEQVFIPLEKGTTAEWASIKTYWYTWRKMHLVLNPDAYWLGRVEASLQNLDGQFVFCLTPPPSGGLLTARYQAAEKEHMHKLRTYVSPTEGVSAPINQVQATPEEIAAIEARQALAMRWAGWMEAKSRTDLDPTTNVELFDWYKEPWDSPKAVAFRAGFGG